METLHPIKTAAMRSGLSTHAIRMWEKRYEAVVPTRTATNRRLYSEADIIRLSLLRQASQAGYAIGQIANASDEELRELIRKTVNLIRSESPSASSPSPSTNHGSLPESKVEEAIGAIRELDANRLEEVLETSMVSMGRRGLLHQVLAPLIQRIGDLWREGLLRVAEEHFATTILTTCLGNIARRDLDTNAPTLIVATPSGQQHVLGAALISAAAVIHGWNAVFLGGSLPVEEIAGATKSKNVDAIAISLVYPENDPAIVRQIEALRQMVGPDMPILIGGRASRSYMATLRSINARYGGDLMELYTLLDEVQTHKEFGAPLTSQDDLKDEHVA